MPREFYPDTERENLGPTNEEAEWFCLNEIEMFDGPGFCMRKKGHRVDVMEGRNIETGEFHQEAYEGWVWDSNGSVS